MTDQTFLARLRFVTRKRRQGGTWGERRSTRRGTGLEFADYRDYAPGDDPRRVDWNLYARLDRPYVRLYEEEEDLSLTVLLDGSASMGWTPEVGGASETGTRWSAALRLATALGTVALLGGDMLTGGVLQAGSMTTAQWGPGRGRVQLPRWEKWVTTLHPSGATRLAPALQAWAARAARPGLVLLISDAYDPAGLTEGIAALAARGHEVVLLHLLLPEELTPALRGDLRLIDVESGDKREVTIDRALLAAYQQRLTDWQEELRTLVARHGGRYALLRADIPLRRMVLEDLRRAGIVR